MDLILDDSLAARYKSNSQKIRVMSESWIAENIYCPCCGNAQIQQLENNSPVADMQCPRCGEIFELKTKKGTFGRKISDGAYATMIDRITSTTNPDLFVMCYHSDYSITDLIIIPKFFFVPQIIEKRKPLAPTARRAGWTGCNILYTEIPEQGRIKIIQNGQLLPADDVVKKYNNLRKLQTKNLDLRGWMLDVLNCINRMNHEEFTLKELYAFADSLQQKHRSNNNVEAKIRQQLQLLRDKGLIEFLGKGHYRIV